MDVAVTVPGVNDGFIGRNSKWDCGEVSEVVVGGVLDVDSVLTRRIWLLEAGDSPVRIEVVIVLLVSRLRRRVGLDAERGIEILGRFFWEETILAIGAGDAGTRL